MTVQEAAKAAGVGVSTVFRAKEVRRKGVPEVVDAVKAGDLSRSIRSSKHHGDVGAPPARIGLPGGQNRQPRAVVITDPVAPAV